MSDKTGWDGSGIDPWLPERIAAQGAITAAERRMYASWWGSFSDWMVGVKRGVFGNTDLPPQAQAVFARSPEWAAAMDKFVQGPVRDVIGQAYRTLFGDSYLFDSRPAVTAHLAEVTNRMVRTPDHVFDVVSKEVANGAAAGESIPAITKRVQEVLDTTANEDWQNRAVTVARTETLGALNAGRSDSFAVAAETSGAQVQQQWLATIDGRVRPEHAAADGQVVGLNEPFIVGFDELMYPGDPNGSAEMVINCRCTVIPVINGEANDMSDRGWADWQDWGDEGDG